jgi:tetratricopeptide (TPR) repeat protein
MDVDSLEPGVDFTEAIKRAVTDCQVVLAVIGREWVDARDERGRRRLENSEDFVVVEIQAALSAGVRVIPVLVDEARMPRRDELPAALQGLERIHAVKLQHESFRRETDRLIQVIEKKAPDRGEGGVGDLTNDPELQPTQRQDAELPWWLQSALQTSMYGRDELLDELLRGVEKNAAVGVFVVLLRGDPGVGKTRLLAELARCMSERDVGVLAGWCDPEGIVPFGPIMEAFRPLIEQAGSISRSPIKQTSDIISLYVNGDTQAQPSTDPETDRLRFFEAMATLFRQTADDHPLFLVIDDIHWLDPSSAALLRHLLRQPAAQPVVLAGCYRSDPTEYSAAWTRILHELQRPQVSSIIDVTQLSPDASMRLIGDLAEELGEVSVDSLTERVLPLTGGNPLFLREVIAQMGLAGTSVDHRGVPLPPTMVASVSSRLQALDVGAQQVVNAAAVLGREFALQDLAEVTGQPTENVLMALDQARSARLVDEIPDLLDRFHFRHALIREAVHDLMPRSRSVRLHIAAGEAYGRRQDVGSLIARAVHLLDAVPVCSAETAAQAAVAAADEALGRLAFEQATRVIRRALSLTGPGSQISEVTRFELLIRLGRALAYQEEGSASDESFAAAASVARVLHDPSRLAIAALGDDLDTRALTPSPTRVELLAEALVALGQDESPLRVAVASTYVTVASRTLGANSVRGLAEETVELARLLGDPLVLSKALLAWTTCMSTSVDPVERLAVATEALGLAEAAGHPSRAARARLTRLDALLRLGRAAEAEAEHGRYGALAESSHVPRHRWHADVVAATLSLLRGRFSEADDFAARALATGQRFGIAEASMAFGVHKFFDHLHRGRLAELRPMLDAFAASRPDLVLWKLGAALAAVEAEDLGQARAVLDEFVATLPDLDPEEEFSSDQLLLAAQLASLLEAGPSIAEVLWSRLLPCRGQFEVFGASAGTLGPVDRVLGLLAAERGQHRDALTLLSAAFELCRTMSAIPWLVWTAADLALELRAGGDAAQADQIAASVEGMAEQLELGEQARRLRAAARGGD